MSEQGTNNIFNNWDNLTAPVRNDLVFEDRNKSYGAYDLRRNQNKTLAKSFLITSVVFGLIIGFPKIVSLLSNTEKDVEVPLVITDVNLTPPPPIDDKEPPPPPPPPPPPVQQTIKFTPPVVKDDEVAEESVPIIKEDIQISTTTQEGDGSDDIPIPEETGKGVVEAAPEEIFVAVSDMPEFPGGDAQYTSFLQKNIVYPQMEKENGISGTCYIEVVIGTDGSLNDAKVVRGVNNGQACDREALRVVKMMPKWKPGKQNGHVVKVKTVIRIGFKLTD